MSGLIVDFPRIEGSVKCRGKKQSKLTIPKVCFSEISLLTITEHATEEELKLRWYSKKERHLLEAGFSLEVAEKRWRLESAPNIVREDLYECVGMERLLSRDVYVETRERRSQHVRAILVAQDRLRMLNMPTEEHLSRISERSSEWTVMRSHDIATQYWDLLKT